MKEIHPSSPTIRPPPTRSAHTVIHKLFVLCEKKKFFGPKSKLISAYAETLRSFVVPFRVRPLKSTVNTLINGRSEKSSDIYLKFSILKFFYKFVSKYSKIQVLLIQSRRRCERSSGHKRKATGDQTGNRGLQKWIKF